MAENTVENTKSLVDDHGMADSLTATASNDEKKISDTIDTEKGELDPKEVSSMILKKEKDESENLTKFARQLAEQNSACKTNCNGDPKEAADAREEAPTDYAILKTKESNLKESNFVETKSSDESAVDYLPDVDERLSEILKVVHGDLHVNFLKSCVKQGGEAKDDANEASSDEKKQQIATKEFDIVNDDTVTDSAKDSATPKGAEDVGDEATSRDSTKMEQRSELGIVGPPTAVSELINEEELRGDSALSVDQKEHIVEWVENSVKVKVEEENNEAEEDKMENDTTDKRVKRRKINDAPTISSRKSQKLVSNIIKKSIKW